MSTDAHLDEASLDALLSGAAVSAATRGHLSSPCDACEEFLARHEGPGLLDGLTDAALLSLTAPRDAPLDARGFARLKLPPAARGPRPGGWALAAAVVLGLAASVLVVFTGSPPGPDAGKKGEAPERVELQALLRSPEGALEPLAPGAVVPARGTILFRAQSPRAGPALLLVQRGAGPIELLHATRVESGLEDVRSDGGALGFSLEGEAGLVVVWLVVGDERTSPSLEGARTTLESGAQSSFAVGRFELHVAP